MSKTRDTGKVLTAAGGLWLHPDDPAEAPGILDAACVSRELPIHGRDHEGSDVALDAGAV